MNYLIGFATKFYTLWNHEEEKQYIFDSYGNAHCVGVIDRYFYIKNISIDLNKVKELFPNVPIDDNLRGKERDFEFKKSFPNPFGYFWVGKYKGQLISEVIKKDLDYCLWAIKSLDGDIQKAIKETSEYQDYISKKEREEKEKLDNANLLMKGQVVELEFTTNGLSHFYADYSKLYDEEMPASERFFAIATHGEKQIIVKLKDCKPVEGRFPYLMPIINGKAQRTKGKKVLVTIEEIEDSCVTEGHVQQTIKVS